MAEEVLHAVNLAALEANKKGFITDWTVNTRCPSFHMSGMYPVFVSYAMNIMSEWVLSAISFADWEHPFYKKVSLEQTVDMIQTMTPEQIYVWLREEGSDV